MTLYLFRHGFSAGEEMFEYDRWFFELNIFQGSFCYTNLWLNLRFVAVARNEIKIGTRIRKSRSIHSHAWFKLYRTLCVTNSIFYKDFAFATVCHTIFRTETLPWLWCTECVNVSVCFCFYFCRCVFVYIVYVRLDDCVMEQKTMFPINTRIVWLSAKSYMLILGHISNIKKSYSLKKYEEKKTPKRLGMHFYCFRMLWS